MDWDKLKLFYITAKIGNISKAARELRVTQSALSRRISSLEEDLGVQLLNRHLRGVTLTPQGKAIFPTLERAFIKLESLSHMVTSLDGTLHGEIRVASNFGFIDTWLNYFLPEFIQEYPDIRMSVMAKESINDLIDEDIDVAITSHFPDSPLVEKDFLMSWHRSLYASKGYLEKFGTPRKVEDLGNHRLISFGVTRGNKQEDREWLLKIGAPPGEARDPYLSINSMRALLNAAQHDLGIISFSRESILLQDTNLVRVLPQVEGPKIDVYLVYLKQRAGLERIRVFCDFLRRKSEHLKPII
jgi:DNA-binding transcriptional LysR family regulator